MSFTIDMIAPKERCEHCGQRIDTPSSLDPTYNLSAIFHFALTGQDHDLDKAPSPFGIRRLHGRTGENTLAEINTAIDRLKEPRNAEVCERLVKDNNGWGTHAQAITVMTWLSERAAKYPKQKWEIR